MVLDNFIEDFILSQYLCTWKLKKKKNPLHEWIITIHSSKYGIILDINAPESVLGGGGEAPISGQYGYVSRKSLPFFGLGRS